MKVALCYDRINKFGGAERVLQVLHDMWPNAPVFTLTYSPEATPWTKGWDIRTSFLQKIPFLGKRHELFPPFAAIAWELFDFREYDVVISVTSAEAKSILIKPGCIHLCYCLTPTRYYWSGYFDYLKNPGMGKLSMVVRFLFPFFAYMLRVGDYFHSQRPTSLIGISDEVVNRIKKYYRRDAFKLYPPVKLPSLMHQKKQKSYFLVVSRLVPYKRIDIVVEAFNRLNWPLIIVGEGSQSANLRALAGNSVSFKGFVSDSELAELYSGAVALLFPTHEDFGIVPVEAQAYGTPVVAYRGGGAVETVVEGQTGVFFDSQTADSLWLTLNNLSHNGNFESAIEYFGQFKPSICEAQAKRFSQEVFSSQLITIVNTLTKKSL